jgi:hypothetical protein
MGAMSLHGKVRDLGNIAFALQLDEGLFACMNGTHPLTLLFATARELARAKELYSALEEKLD